MSSVAITGKPGSSKSYLATTWLVDELLNSDRAIVTNLPLRLDNIVRHLIAMGREDVDVYGRVQILDYDQVAEFWRYRGPGVEPLPAISREEVKAGVRPSFDSFGTKGVRYFLDELHEHLNSRQWASTGEVVLWYIAKHRHFGDDVTWMSQSPANVDKQWRSVTQEYWECRNFAKETFRGFAKGRFCQAQLFLELPTPSSSVQDTKKYPIDPKGIGRCYYTSLAKGKADTKEKPRGIHLYWLFAGVIALGIGVMLVFHYAPYFIKGAVTPHKASVGQLNVDAPQKNNAQPHNAGAQHPSATVGVTGSEGVQRKDEPKPVQIVAVPLRDVTADEVLTAMQGNQVASAQGTSSGSFGGISAIRNAANDAVLVSGQDLQQVVAYAQVVRTYDRQTALITVNAVVGRLVRGRSSKVGLNDLISGAVGSSSASGLATVLDSMVYDFSTGIATFGTALAARQVLQIVTDFQARDYRFEVVSRPTLSVLSGQSGNFGTGQEIPLPQTVSDASGTRTSVQYKSAEFGFTVTPTIKPDGWVRLLIDQKNSDVLSSAQIGGSTVPTLSTQNLKTIIDLEPSQIAYLGGINVHSRNKERRGVPYLKDIPGLNLIFGTRETGSEDSELVVLVSVEINKKAPVRVLRAIPVSRNADDFSWTDDTSTLSPTGAAEQDKEPVTNSPENQKQEK